MRAALPLVIIVALSAAGCARLSQSSFNPLNWFGSSSEAAAVPQDRGPLVPATGGPVETRPLVASVTTLRVDRTPGGAIVVAQGEVPTQGYFNAELVQTGLSGGVLALAFRAEAPTGFEATGAIATRTITAALNLGANDLDGVRTIRVEGQTNARTAAR